ncbi:MAG TPA: hypothetical protein VFR87_00140 [Nocardioidaceae bacterium]|nr:hypothetical protein [Nocardioidaceae bacterium]
MPADVSDGMPEQRVMEQSVRLPTDGAVTGWAACRLHRAAFFDGLDRDGVTRLPVPLALGTKSRIRGDSAVRLSREKLAEDEVVDLRGLRYTTICRALFDAMRWAPDVREACVAMDMAAAAELASVSMMRGYVDSHSGWEGIEQVRDALELADENSKSPNETRLRLIWILDAGLPPLLVNAPVFDSRGGLLGIADLLDPVAGVVGEFDGAAHRTARRHRRDVVREDLFRRAGLEYFKVVGLDLRDPATLVAPDGWYECPEDLMTLDQRIAYRASLRAEAG